MEKKKCNTKILDSHFAGKYNFATTRENWSFDLGSLFSRIDVKPCPLVYLQVSTSTGVISHMVNLQVVVPEAFILGSGELHVDMGSTINLVCIIEKVSADRKLRKSIRQLLEI
jgi:hypothetical protein